MSTHAPPTTTTHRHPPTQMLIKGIRSFSPENQNVIEFYKPLTLIVGANGAGKTVGRSHLARFRPVRPATTLPPPPISHISLPLGPDRPPDRADGHRVPQAGVHGRAAAQHPLGAELYPRPQGKGGLPQHARTCRSMPCLRRSDVQQREPRSSPYRLHHVLFILLISRPSPPIPAHRRPFARHHHRHHATPPLTGRGRVRGQGADQAPLQDRDRLARRRDPLLPGTPTYNTAMARQMPTQGRARLGRCRAACLSHLAATERRPAQP